MCLQNRIFGKSWQSHVDNLRSTERSTPGVELGSDVELSVIVLNDGIRGNVPGTCNAFCVGMARCDR